MLLHILPIVTTSSMYVSLDPPMNIEWINNLEIYVVYDNNPYREGLRASWGLSLYIIADNETILFDTGGDGDILLYNMEALGLDPKDIDVIVLSHIHGDHTGGLFKLLEVNPSVTVYLPRSFPSSFKEQVRSMGAEVVEVHDPMVISNGVMVTGEISCGGGLYEEALVINTSRGLVILTGCAHPGVDNIVAKVVNILGYDKILLVGGGFHLGGASRERIMEIIDTFKKYHVGYVMPIHCSGDTARQLFKENYEDHCLLGGVGFSIKLGDLVGGIAEEVSTTPIKSNITQFSPTTSPSTGASYDLLENNLIPIIIGTLALTIFSIIIYYWRVYRSG